MGWIEILAGIDFQRPARFGCDKRNALYLGSLLRTDQSLWLPAFLCRERSSLCVKPFSANRTYSNIPIDKTRLRGQHPYPY